MKSAVKLLVLSFLFMSFNLNDGDYTLLKSIEKDCHYATTDNLGNAFLANKRGDIIKYDRNGDSLMLQNFSSFGEISHIDASNAFEMYVHFNNNDKVIFLDNQMSFRGELNLVDLGYSDVSIIARSQNNGVWLFDQNTMRLLKLDKSGKIINEGATSNTYSSDAIQPHYLLDNQNELYLCDSLSGIYVFDNFGTFSKKLDLKIKSGIQVIKGELIYQEGNYLKRYNLNLHNETEVELPDSIGINSVRIEKNRLYIIKDNKVDLYAY
jgi:hypothetical protein